MRKATRMMLAAWLAVQTCAAAAVQLIDIQPNPHWRKALQARSEEVIAERVAKAEAAGELGCRRYCDELAAVFRRVTQVAMTQVPTSARYHWALVVTRSRNEDAYAVPDGRIVISEAFIEREHLSQEELAFVLAHEVSHVILAHEADTLDTVQAILPHGVNASVQDLYAAMDFDMGLLLRIAPFMVAMEREADRLGLMLTALAGYKPGVAIGYARQLAAEGKVSEMAATHPQGSARLADLRGLLPVAQRIYERYGRRPLSR